jgi:predicted TIM-barrel enzyme
MTHKTRRSKKSQPATSGESSIGQIRLTRTLPQVAERNSTTKWIFCPWLKRAPQDNHIWRSVLPIHDVNGTLLAELPISRRMRHNVYAGVFAVDLLRTTSELIQHLKRASIAGVINFPSVSFIEADTGAVFSNLSLGIDREVDFLEACSRHGLRIAGVVRSPETAKRLINIGVDFLVAHGGPPTRDNKDPHASAVRKIKEIADPKGVTLIPISQLIRRLRKHFQV